MTDSTYIRSYNGKSTRLDNLCLGADNNSYRLYVNGTSYFTNYLQTTSYFKSTVADGTSPIQVNSTTLNPHLNADLLDGYHETAFPRLVGIKNGTWNWNDMSRAGYYKIQAGTITNHPSNVYNYGMAEVLTTENHGDGENRVLQIYYPHNRSKNNSPMYLRMHNGNDLTSDGQWTSWCEVASTDSNVASATKLKTARAFQTNLASDSANNFDGSANCTMGVTGVLPVKQGGTGATTAAAAKANIGLGNVANIDQSKAIKSITRSGTTFTATALDGTKTTFDQQDTNTTYSGVDISKMLFMGTHEEAAAGGSNQPTAGMATGTYGLYLTASYRDSVTPTSYGNIINVAASGSGQLFLGWSGTDNYTEHIWYRSHRDTSTGGWGNWRKVLYADEIVSTVKSFTLSASSWSSGAYTISDSLITASSNQEILPATTITAAQYNALSKAQIIDAGQSAGKLTLKALGTVPTIDIPIRIIFRGTI